MAKNIVHVIGTGTIGEPLIGLLSRFRTEFDISEVTFHKRTPLSSDRPKVQQLTKLGALLAVDAGREEDFAKMGHKVAYESEEAVERATVVIDCTPSGVAAENKQKYYRKYSGQVRGFIAQGSEFGFGKMYARGINDAVLDRQRDQFLQVVSCNTHNISVLLSCLGSDVDGKVKVEEGRFLCLRRANDISQDTDFIPAPEVGKHSEPRFGTHHARDAYYLFQTLGYDLNLFSSACLINTQYMHALHFAIRTGFKITKEEVLARLRENRRIALTEKRSANAVFSFGREHGLYGRILSQTVMSVPTIMVRGDHEIVGFCFTPQDGNSLLSSIAATLWFLDPESLERRMDSLRPYLFQEV